MNTIKNSKLDIRNNPSATSTYKITIINSAQLTTTAIQLTSTPSTTYRCSCWICLMISLVVRSISVQRLAPRMVVLLLQLSCWWDCCQQWNCFGSENPWCGFERRQVQIGCDLKTASDGWGFQRLHLILPLEMMVSGFPLDSSH